MKGRISHIQRFSLGDGPGIRTTVFFKGCPLHCAWCHNPETIHKEKQLMYHKNLCVSCGLCASVCGAGAHMITSSGEHELSREKCVLCGKCASVCPHGALEINGKVLDSDEIMKAIYEDKDFYAESGGGVTLSGGEPLSQPEFAVELARKCSEAGIRVLIDTAAQASFEVFEDIMQYADEYYVDLKAATEEDYRKMTGGSLKPVTDNITGLVKAGKRVTIRIPVIPGHNFSVEYMKKMADVLVPTGAKTVNLLPFHNLCAEKYTALGRKYPYSDIESLKKEQLVPLLESFKGFDAIITN